MVALSGIERSITSGGRARKRESIDRCFGRAYILLGFRRPSTGSGVRSATRPVRCRLAIRPSRLRSTYVTCSQQQVRTDEAKARDGDGRMPGWQGLHDRRWCLSGCRSCRSRKKEQVKRTMQRKVTAGVHRFHTRRLHRTMFD